MWCSVQVFREKRCSSSRKCSGAVCNLQYVLVLEMQDVQEVQEVQEVQVLHEHRVQYFQDKQRCRKLEGALDVGYAREERYVWCSV